MIVPVGELHEEQVLKSSKEKNKIFVENLKSEVCSTY